MKIEIPKFETKSELHAWLVKNESDLIYQKKAEKKLADCMVPIDFKTLSSFDQVDKSTSSNKEAVVKTRAIINTTNVYDSHGDVHIKGWANKSIKDNKFIKHLQEHNMAFKAIIADKEDLKVFMKTYTWKDLGIDADGETEALVFDSDVKQSRNPYMYEQYKDGHVDNHSVGMYYVNVKLAFKSQEDEYKDYNDRYEKHIDEILNKVEVEQDGMFWAVYEAKVVEGSAVPLGSNFITPTLSREKHLEKNDGKAADKALSEAIINFLKK